MSVVDIALVNPPPWGLENPPIGVSFLETYLEKHGLKAEVYDLNVALHNNCDPTYRILWNVDNRTVWKNEETFPYILSIFSESLERWVEHLANSGARVVGFSAVDGKEALIVEMVRRLKAKAPEKLIVLGGPACHSAFSRQYFIDRIAHLLDAIVYGEGEETLLEWLKNALDGRTGDLCSGALIKRNGVLIDGGPRPPIAELDAIPFPTFGKVDIGEYQTSSLPLVWSRGCVCKCTFCKETTLTDKYRYNSPGHVVESLIYYKDRYGVEDFFVWDSAVNGNLKQLRDICAGVKEADIGIRWKAMAIPHKHMTYELCALLKDAGCVKLNYGVESGSGPLLKGMRKAFSAEDAAKALRATHQAGIECTINLLVGFPGETDESVETTCSFLRENRDFVNAVESLSILQMVDGTELFLKATDYGIALPENDWFNLWHTADSSNTIAIRQDWAKRIKDEIQHLGIPLFGANTCLQDDKNTKSKSCTDVDNFHHIIFEVYDAATSASAQGGDKEVQSR